MYNVHDLVEIIGDHDRFVRKIGCFDAKTAEFFCLRPLPLNMVGDRGVRVFELMPGEDADHPVAGGDDPLFTQQFRPGDTGTTGGLATESARTHLSLAIEDRRHHSLRERRRHTHQGPADTS